MEWLRREVRDVDMHEAKVVVLEGAFSFGGLRRCRFGAAVQPLHLENRPQLTNEAFRTRFATKRERRAGFGVIGIFRPPR